MMLVANEVKSQVGVGILLMSVFVTFLLVEWLRARFVAWLFIIEGYKFILLSHGFDLMACGGRRR